MADMHPKRIDPIWKPGEVLKTPIGEVILERQLGVGKSGYSHLARLNDRFVIAKRMHDEPTPFYTFHDNKCALEYRAYIRLKRAGVPMPALLHLNPKADYLIKEYVAGMDGLEAVARGFVTNDVISELIALSDACRERKINLDWFPANFVLLDSPSGVRDSMLTMPAVRHCEHTVPDAVERPVLGLSGSGHRSHPGLSFSHPDAPHGHPDVPRSHPERSEGSMFSNKQLLVYIDYEINEYSDEWSFEQWGVWYWANREGVARFLETGDSSAINDPPDSGKPIKAHQEVVQRWLET